MAGARPNIGEFRHRVAIQAIVSQTRSATSNQLEPVYGTIGMRWAKIEDKAGEGLSINQAATRAQLNHVSITMRYFSGLTVNHRLVFGGEARNLDLSSLDTDELDALDAGELAEMRALPPKPASYYRISAIADPLKSREFHVVDGVEVAG